MKKNKPILILTASLLLGLLASCGTGGTTDSSSPDDVTDSSSPADVVDSSSPISSEDPIPVKYSISLVQIEGASIAADKTEAEEGETVTITISDYDAKTVTPTPVATPELTFTADAGNDDVWTFAMPANDVSITATLETVTYGVSAKYISQTTDAPTFAYTVDGEAADPTAIPAGASVTLVASGFSYLSAGKRAYLYTDTDTLSADAVEGDDKVISVTYTFTMPTNDLDLVLAPAGGDIAEDGNTVSVTLPEAGFKAYGYKSGDKYSNSGSFSVLFTVETGYLLDSVTYTVSGSETENSLNASSSSTVDGLYGATIYAYKFTGDVTITINGTYKGVKNITWVGLDGIASIGGTAVSDLALPSSATVGKSISYYSVVAVDGKYVSSIVVTGADNTEITSSTYSSFGFTMPDQDVTITFTTATAPTFAWASTDNLDEYFVASSSGYSYSSALNNKITSAKPGDYVYAYIKPASGYKPTGVTITCGDSTETKTPYSSYGVDGIYYCNFKVPTGGDTVTIDVTLSQTFTVSVGESNLTGCSLNVSSSSYGAGETGSVTITKPDNFYKLTGLTATYDGSDHVWKEVEYSEYDKTVGTYYVSGSYVYFAMPSANITLTGTFEEIESVKFTVTLGDSTNIKSAKVNTKSTYSYFEATADGATGKATAEESIGFTNVQCGTDYYVTVTVTYTDDSAETIKPSSVSIWSSYNACYYSSTDGIPVTKTSGTTTATIKSVVFNAVKRDSVTATVTNGYSKEVTLSYAVNDTTVTSLDSLLTYDSLAITATKTDAAESGYKYTVVVTDESGNVLEPDSYGCYTLTGNIKISVTKSVSYGVSVVTDGITVSGLYFTINGTANYTNWSSLEFALGDTVGFSYVYAYDSNWSSSTWTATIKTGDSTYTYTATQYQAEYNGIATETFSFKVEGSVTITFSATTSSAS